jgi:hypothetical protein
MEPAPRPYERDARAVWRKLEQRTAAAGEARDRLARSDSGFACDPDNVDGGERDHLLMAATSTLIALI